MLGEAPAQAGFLLPNQLMNMSDEYPEGNCYEDEYEETLQGGVAPYRTSDLGCAAALHCRGFSPIELDRKDSQRVEFLFTRSRDAMSVVSAYWDNGLGVDAQSYFSSIRFLKNRLYSPE